MFSLFILLFGLFSFSAFLKGFHECKAKKNPYGLTPAFNIIGAFVWGDAVVFGIFWTFTAVILCFLNDPLLFAFIFSVFWLVRSIGETIYWLNQQFSTVKRDPPETLPFHYIFHNESIWYVEQIFWQCIAVITIVTSFLLAHQIVIR